MFLSIEKKHIRNNNEVENSVLLFWPGYIFMLVQRERVSETYLNACVYSVNGLTVYCSDGEIMWLNDDL